MPRHVITRDDLAKGNYDPNVKPADFIIVETEAEKRRLTTPPPPPPPPDPRAQAEEETRRLRAKLARENAAIHEDLKALALDILCARAKQGDTST